MTILRNVDAASNWDKIVDDVILHSYDMEAESHIDSVCILKLADGEVLNDEEHPDALHLSEQERQVIALAWRTHNVEALCYYGVTCEGNEYSLQIAEDGMIQSDVNHSGAILMQATDSVVIVAHMMPNGNPDCAATSVEIMTNYLDMREKGLVS